MNQPLAFVQSVKSAVQNVDNPSDQSRYLQQTTTDTSIESTYVLDRDQYISWGMWDSNAELRDKEKALRNGETDSSHTCFVAGPDRRKDASSDESAAYNDHILGHRDDTNQGTTAALSGDAKMTFCFSTDMIDQARFSLLKNRTPWESYSLTGSQWFNKLDVPQFEGTLMDSLGRHGSMSREFFRPHEGER